MRRSLVSIVVTSMVLFANVSECSSPIRGSTSATTNIPGPPEVFHTSFPFGPPTGTFPSVRSPEPVSTTSFPFGPPTGSVPSVPTTLFQFGPPSTTSFLEGTAPPTGTVTSMWPPSPGSAKPQPDFVTSNTPHKPLCSEGSINSTHQPVKNTSAHSMDKNGVFHFKSENSSLSWIQDSWLNENTFSAVEFIEAICPGSLLCNSGSSRSLEHTPLCCSQCSCSSDCHYANDCCLDFDEPYNTPVTPMTCVVPIFPENRFQDLSPSDRKGYLMIEVCAEGKTVPKDSEVKPPVTSTASNITYLNEGAALCNGEYAFDLKAWSPKIICQRMDYFSLFFRDDGGFAKFSDRFDWFKSCSISWMPDNLPVHECRVISDLEADCDSCSVSGSWLYNLCQNGYIAPFGLSDGRIFQNVFCFGCTYLSTSLTADACAAEAEENVRSMERLAVSGTSASLSVLEAFVKEKISIRMLNEDCRCKNCIREFQLMPYLDICVREVCSLSQVRMHGHCVNVIRTISGLDVEYRVDFRVPESYNNNTDTSLLYETLKNKTLNLIKDDNINVNIIMNTQTILNSKTKEKGYVYITQTVLRRVGFQENLQVTFDRFQQRVMLEGAADEYSPQVSRQSRLEYVWLTDMFLYFRKYAFNEMAMTEMQFCDAFQIPLDQFGVDQNETRLLIGPLTFQPEEYFVTVLNKLNEDAWLPPTDVFFAHICKKLFIERWSECSTCNQTFPLEMIVSLENVSPENAKSPEKSSTPENANVSSENANIDPENATVISKNTNVSPKNAHVTNVSQNVEVNAYAGITIVTLACLLCPVFY